MAPSRSQSAGHDGARARRDRADPDLVRPAGVRRGGATAQRRRSPRCTPLPLLVARRWPLAVLAVVVGAAAIDYVLGGHGGQQWFALLIAVFVLGSYADGGRLRVSGWRSSEPRSSPSTSRASKHGDPIEEVLPGWFVLAGAWGLGAWLQQRRGAMSELAEEAEALVRDRDEATRAAVAYERARIARELHDLVAHAMAIIVLQAQAGGRVLDGDVEAARRAFADIESTGREGLTELRRLLDILLVELPDRARSIPGPGWSRSSGLAQRVREAGLPVELSVTGDPRPLPPGVDISAYRIVQEALTNTLKHAGRASASVGVAYRPGEVELSICDDGAGDPRRASAGCSGSRPDRHARACPPVRRFPATPDRRRPAASRCERCSRRVRRDPHRARRRRGAGPDRAPDDPAAPSRTSRSWARRSTARRRSARSTSSPPTYCCSTCGCPTSTGSPSFAGCRPARSPSSC